MRYLPALAGWLAFLAAAALIATAGAPAERDPSSVSSILAYPLDEEVRFALEPGEREVLLSTRLARPAGRWPPDARVIERWCLDLAVEDPDGATVREWRAWVASRTSVTEDDAGHFAARAWTADADTDVSLPRATRIDLDGAVPTGGVLSVRAGCLAPGARLLAFGARRGERGAVQQLRLQQRDGAAFRAEAAARLGAMAWTDLPEAWRGHLLTNVWDRLGALPPPGGGVNPTVRLSVTMDEAPDREDALRTALVPPGGAVAWNLRGPATFSATWAQLDGSPADPPRATARAVFADGSVEALPVGPDGALGPWRFDAPLVSVQVALDPGQPPLRLRGASARADADPSWGAPPRRETAPGRYTVGPELRTVEMARVLDGAPVRFAVAANEVLRLLFRVPLPPDAPAGFTKSGRSGDPVAADPNAARGAAEPSAAAPGRVPEGPVVAEAARAAAAAACPTTAPGVVCVIVEALAADDAVLARHDVALTPVASPFERYVLGDSPGTASVGEAEARVFVLPRGVAAVRVSSARRVDVSARVTSDHAGTTTDEPGYELPPDASVRRRYAPLERPGWRARSAEAFDDLAAAGRIVRLDGQVRLEPRDPEDPDDGDAARLASAEWHALPFDEPFALLAQPDATPEPATAGAHVRLGADPATVTVPPDGRLAVAYRVDPDHVGDVVGFRVGTEELTRRLAAAGDVLELGPFAPGPARVSAIVPDGLFLARGEGSPAWRVRRVWRAANAVAREIRVPPGAGALRLHAYLAPDDAAWLGWTVTPDASTPAGAYAALTDRAEIATLTPAPARGEALPLTFAGAPLVPARPVTVHIGDDLVGGGVLRLTVDGARAPVWVRATATWDVGGAEAVARHWRRGAPR